MPAAIAACSDDKPAPKTPTQPTVAGSNPTPTQAQISMSDTPSSARSGDLPGAAPRPALSGSAAGQYGQALQAFGSGNLPQARTLFQQVTQSDPRSHQAYYSLGAVQERLRDPGAGASYRQAYTIVPDYEPAIIAYAMLLAKQGQLGEAERFLNEKRGQMPKSAAVAATLAEVKSLQKDTGSAQRIAQEALKINPDYRPAMVIIARDHYRNRRLDLALYALQAILDGFGDENPARDKENGEALLLRGLILKEQGNRVGAMEQFKKAVVHRPDLVEARVQLGTALLQAGGADEALPVLEGAVRYDNDHLPAHLNLGDAYRLLGRYGDAKREFEWVMAHEAGLPQVHYDLGLLYLYAPSVPGMTAAQQADEAVNELTKFREVRARDERDDSEELLNAAKNKVGEIKAASAPAAPAAGRGALGGPARRPTAARPRPRRRLVLNPRLASDRRTTMTRTTLGLLTALALLATAGQAAAQDKGKEDQAARGDHPGRGDHHRSHPEADRRRGREPHPAQADPGRAAAAVPRPDRAGDLQGSLLSPESRGRRLPRALRARRARVRGARLGARPQGGRRDGGRSCGARARAQAGPARRARGRAAAPRGARELGARARLRGARRPRRGGEGRGREPVALRGGARHDPDRAVAAHGPAARRCSATGLLGFSEYIEDPAQLEWALATVAVGGVAAVACVEARRSGERAAERQRRGIDALVATALGLPEEPREGADAGERGRPRASRGGPAPRGRVRSRGTFRRSA